MFFQTSSTSKIMHDKSNEDSWRFVKVFALATIEQKLKNPRWVNKDDTQYMGNSTIKGNYTHELLMVIILTFIYRKNK